MGVVVDRRHQRLTAVCGTTRDRDINAAINIRQHGIVQLKAAGLSVSIVGRMAYAHGGGVNPSPIGMVAA